MKNLFQCLAFLFILFLTTTISAQTVDEVVYDQFGAPFRDAGPYGAPWGKHEGALHGVPSNYDWANGARPGDWLNAGSNEAMSSWGQVYEWAGESPVTNIRVHIRNHKTYAYANGSWQLVEDGGIGGTNFSEDFTSSSGISDERNEPDGGVSVDMHQGWNYHWWVDTWPRASFPAGTEAIYSVCEVRLIQNTGNVNLNNAKYLAGISCDYYPTNTSSGHGPWPSLTITRHKWLTPQWQKFTMYIADPLPSTAADYKTEILSRPLPPGVTNGGSTGGQSAYGNGGNPWQISNGTRIEAENYDNGGQGTAYNDTNSNNSGNSYRTSEGVDVQPTTDTGGGYNVGWTDNNEWLEYTTNVTGGNYNIKLRVASAGSTVGDVRVKLGGTTLGTFNVNNTGGWQNWQTLTLNNISLPGGNDQVLRLEMVGSLVNINWIEFENAGPQINSTYSENFNDNNAQNWSLSSNVSVSGQKMSATNWASGTSAVYNGLTFSAPYIYKLDMLGEGGSTGNANQIVFNYSNSNNYYFVEFTGGGSGTATLKKNVGGTISTIGSSVAYATTGANVNVEISYNDNKITVKATKSGNTTTLFNNVSDASFTSGKIGALTYYRNTEIDNVEVQYSSSTSSRVQQPIKIQKITEEVESEFPETTPSVWVYPNPARNKFTINTNDFGEQVQLRIFDLQGRTVYTKQVKGKNASVEVGLDHLNGKGLYLIDMTSKTKTYRSKILVTDQ